jgi:CRISPR-associated protein Cas1|tara:strand:+ start:1296 stop:2294 length:999 start_codon:yes stop_codon:yes gene_type:complete
MATLYLTEQGSKLGKTSRRLVVEKDKKLLLEIPEFKVERVLIFGNVQITTQAIVFLLVNGIETSFLSMQGRLKGRLSPIESKNVLLRIKQYEKYHDANFRLGIARLIIGAKVSNSRTILLRYARNHPEIDLEESKKRLDDCTKNLESKETIKSLMGVEGIAASIYFRAYGKLFRRELKFEKRQRRPVRDPVNALLSFGYVLITNEMLSVACAIGFEPYIGYLHGVDYGRPSLALDMVEEFRQPIVDRFTLYLINNQILKEDDFEDKGDEGIFLKDEAKKSYFVQFEKYMNREIESSVTAEKKSFRKLFRLQSHKLMDTILKDEPYKPFLLRN